MAQPALGSGPDLEKMRRRWATALSGRILNPEGYVLTEQHDGPARARLRTGLGEDAAALGNRPLRPHSQSRRLRLDRATRWPSPRSAPDRTWRRCGGVGQPPSQAAFSIPKATS